MGPGNLTVGGAEYSTLDYCGKPDDFTLGDHLWTENSTLYAHEDLGILTISDCGVLGNNTLGNCRCPGNAAFGRGGALETST